MQVPVQQAVVREMVMSNNNNQYFETLNRIHGELNEELLVARINECKAVVDELAKSYVMQIVIKDAQSIVKALDDNWQTMIPSDAKFSEARVVKIACKQLVDLPRKYVEELEMLQEKLREMQHPEEVIEKDNDNN